MHLPILRRARSADEPTSTSEAICKMFRLADDLSLANVPDHVVKVSKGLGQGYAHISIRLERQDGES